MQEDSSSSDQEPDGDSGKAAKITACGSKGGLPTG